MPRTAPFPAPFRLAGSLLLAAMLALALPGCGGSSRAEQERLAQAAEEPVEELYNRAVDAMQAERWQVAVELFDEVERLHPYSTWAVTAKLMAIYGQYMRNRYTDAILAADRFIQLHPAHPDVAYAFYLRALCYYEQIVDVTRDQRITEQAMSALQEVANRFPDTDYARDARLKIDLARDHLAGKEMAIGRYYQDRKAHLAAANRFRRVIENYQTTSHVPEALHRLTESYLAMGMTEEARRSAAVLGHNFPGSEWYLDSYELLVSDADAAAAGVRRERPGLVRRWWNRVF